MKVSMNQISPLPLSINNYALLCMSHFLQPELEAYDVRENFINPAATVALPAPKIRTDWIGGCAFCEGENTVDQFCSVCGACFHTNCYSSHEHCKWDEDETVSHISLVTVTSLAVSPNQILIENFVLRLEKFPYKQYILTINQDCTNGFLNERQYFQDIKDGIISPSMSSKWVAYIHNHWWKNKVYNTEDQIYKDKEFTTEMYKTKLCYITCVGSELKLPRIC